jgi:branched-chain amino acid transport system permease protein
MMKSLRINLSANSVSSALLFLFLLTYPVFGGTYSIINLTGFMYSIVFASSLVLIWGYCGIFSFGQAAFFGIGGYFYAVVSLNLGNPIYTPLVMVLSIVAGFAVAWVFGYFIFYGGVNDVFVGVITLSFGVACETFMLQTAGPQWRIGKVLLGGYNGINQIPPLTLGKYALSGKPFYYFVLLVVLAIFIVLKTIERRKVGFSLIAVREGRNRSELLGYNTAKIKTFVFAFGGATAALAGVLYTMWGGYIVPALMGMVQSTIPVVLVAAGGRKDPTAVFIFTLVYLKIAQILASKGTQYAFIVLGVIMILVVLFVPNGIFDALLRYIDHVLFDRFRAKKPQKRARMEER